MQKLSNTNKGISVQNSRYMGLSRISTQAIYLNFVPKYLS